MENSSFHEHPHRAQLLSEAHARPPLLVPSPASLIHVSFLQEEEKDQELVFRHVSDLCARAGQKPPEEQARFHLIETPDAQIAWERHTEFTTFTFLMTGEEEAPFAAISLEKFETLLQSPPGLLFGATRLEILSRKGGQPDQELACEMLESDNFPISTISGGSATVATGFKADSDGFVRIMIFDDDMQQERRGRMAQRILEIDTYRIAALLALPLAREAGSDLAQLEKAADTLTERLNSPPHVGNDQMLLEQLSGIAGDIQALDAKLHYRFAAAQAYDNIMRERLERLREERIEGRQRVGVFLEQRQAPAMRTCVATQRRLVALSERVGRSSQLLAARVNVALEDQNARLLSSMDGRARLQLRLQETVEGLSAVAITYYGTGLINYFAKGLADGIFPALNVNWVTAISAPIIFAVAWISIRQIRRQIRK